MASLSVLANVPGYAGYLARRGQIEDQQAQEQQQELVQAGALQRLYQNQQTMRTTQEDRATAARDRAQLESVMSATGGDPQKAIAALLKAGTPKSIELASKLKGLLPTVTEQWSEPYDMGGAWVQKNATTGQIRQAVPREPASASGGANPYYTFISTPEGIVAGDARTGSVAPVQVRGRRVMKAPDDPANRGRIAGAVVSGEAQARRAFNMGGIGAIIKSAEDILHGRDTATGRPVTKPTGSGVGALYDRAAGLVGVSPSGAKEAQALKAVSGALTAKMPRMEGPQSDRDVQLYREMAAEIGNDGLPIDRRIQALEVVKSLWAKYERLNPGAFVDGQLGADAAPARPAPQGVDQADWDAMTPEERALWP